LVAPLRQLEQKPGADFTVSVCYTEEKLGQAEKTELDAHFESLLARADCTKNWTEKIYRQTEVLLQPNPSARIEEFLYEKLDRKLPYRATNGEILGQYMLEAAKEFGPGTPYGSTLIQVGDCQRRLGGAEREFLQTSSISFLTPLRNFLEGDWRTITKERRLLENRRLDLDACKARLKKAKAAEAKAAVSFSLYSLYSILPPQLPLFIHYPALSSTSCSVNHLRCLHEFVEAQATYYNQCHHFMQELQKELSRRYPNSFLVNPRSVRSSSGDASSTVPVNSLSPEAEALQIEEVQPPASGTRKAKVLYDYDAADSSELSLLADELITVYTVPGMDSDWLIGERGNQKGKVPVTYLELLS
uniref:Endophilin-B1 n=1 Tax=Astyanax mexicanus TaxID=7994 RepID=A0A8B9GUZ6_ASTMX